MTTTNIATAGLGDNPSTPQSGTPEPRDPHPEWWIEHRRIGAELSTWTYSHPDSRDDEPGGYDDRCKRLDALERAIFNTHVLTFEGADALVDALRFEIAEDCDELKLAGFDQFKWFFAMVAQVLARHDLGEQVERWLWEIVPPQAEAYRDHPAKPADAEAIYAAAHYRRDAPDADLPTIWRRYQEARDEINADSTVHPLPEDGDLLTLYHGLRDQLWQARPTDPAGLAVQLRFYQETVADSDPSPADEAILAHVVDQLTVLGARS